MKDQHIHDRESNHDREMMANSWSKKLAHYGCYFITFKREAQILNRMDRKFGDRL